MREGIPTGQESHLCGRGHDLDVIAHMGVHSSQESQSETYIYIYIYIYICTHNLMAL